MSLSVEQRSTLINRGGELFRTALQAGRQLTEPENNELRAINAQLDQAEYESLHPPPTQQSEAQRRFTSGMETRSAELRPGQVRVLTNKQKLSDYTPQASDDFSIGRIVQARVLGNYSRLTEAEVRVMNEGTGSAGGFTVPTPLSARLIDLARNQTRVIQAGAVTIPMDSSTLKMARALTDPTAAWKVENAADAGASDLSFEQVLFTAHTLVARGKMSVELFEDGQNIDQVVSNALSAALAQELDRVALTGTGTPPEPKGVKNQTGINTFSAAGPLVDYSDFIHAIQLIMEANQEPNGIILSPRSWAQLEGLTDTSDQPLMAPKFYSDLPKFVTKQVGDYGSPATSESAYVADWKELMIGMRTNITLEVSRVASDASSRAFDSLQVFFRAYLRADVQLGHPGAFTVITGLTAS